MSELDAFIPVINGHIDYFGIKKKKNNYSIKRINSFGSITLIEKYISKLLLDSSNRINGNEIEMKIKNCFNLSSQEAKDIYSSLIKSLEDQANRSEKDQGDILGILKKKLKKEEENILIQYNDLRDLIVFNFSFINKQKIITIHFHYR